MSGLFIEIQLICWPFLIKSWNKKIEVYQLEKKKLINKLTEMHPAIKVWCFRNCTEMHYFSDLSDLSDLFYNLNSLTCITRMTSLKTFFLVLLTIVVASLIASTKNADVLKCWKKWITFCSTDKFEKPLFMHRSTKWYEIAFCFYFENGFRTWVRCHSMWSLWMLSAACSD